MSTRIVILSDTHLERLIPGLPDEILQEISRSGLVLHAGDFTSEDVYEQLASLAELSAVRGNMDGRGLAGRFPEKREIEVEGVKIGLIHGSGSPQQALCRACQAFKKPDVIVFGHSHQPFKERVAGVLMFNPGSPTRPYGSAFDSYGVIDVTGDRFGARIIPLKGNRQGI